MRAFLTGGSGFVGRWLTAHLEACGDQVEGLPDGVDVQEAGPVVERLVGAAPEVVYHLAALTHVGDSWDAPGETLRVNAVGTLNVLEAARRCAVPPRVILVSSAEVYGRGGGSPLDEQAELRPVSPYAASKVAAEFLGVQAYEAYGIPVVRARPFNHVGPGQSPNFVVSALARRVVEAERAGGGEVGVGNLSPRRDFTDVRDVVRAYRLLAGRGEPGAAYNVCSGRALAVSELLERLLAHAKGEIQVVEEPALVREVDVPVLVGDPGVLRRLTGWAPEIDLERTLVDVLEQWRVELGPTS